MLLLVVVADFGYRLGTPFFVCLFVKSFTGERSGVQARETVVLQQGWLALNFVNPLIIIFFFL